ncbi:MAG TPA: SapC family protein [Gammaproteobacteria bacterium]|nr:SapC family protein [Gammaproteobacteria bacterium]
MPARKKSAQPKSEPETTQENESAAEPAAKTLLFYERPVPLNRDQHRALRLTPGNGDFSFARGINSVPVAGVEFPEACRDYPIVFAGNSPQEVVPSVLLGLRQDENLFVNAEGAWQDTYLPAFVRRYPFVLAEKEGGEEDFTVCVDEGYPGLTTEGEGEALFDEAGKEGPYLQRVLEFLSEFQGQMRRTRTFVDRLNELGLLEQKVIQVAPAGGQPAVLQGLYVIDEQRLQGLDDASIRQLLDAGELAWIYAHLLSLGNVNRLSARLDAANA